MGRKNEPIFGRLIFQASPFTDLKEAGGCFHFYFTPGFARGLEGLQQGEVLLQVAVQALLIEGKELELVRFGGEDAGGGEGGVDLFVVGANGSGVLVKAKSE